MPEPKPVTFVDMFGETVTLDDTLRARFLQWTDERIITDLGDPSWPKPDLNGPGVCRAAGGHAWTSSAGYPTCRRCGQIK